MHYRQPNLSTVLLHNKPQITLTYSGMAVPLWQHIYHLSLKCSILQCLCVICSQYPVQNTHLTKKYQHKDHFSKVQENNTASCWCWRQKCLTVEGTIMKMGCRMKKKCHIQLPSFPLPVSCVSKQMSGN